MRVNVAGWSNSREVLVRDGKVSFEVGMDHNHCATCASRVRHIEHALAHKAIPHKFEGGRGSSLYVTMDLPLRGVGVVDHLEQALGIRII